MARWQMGAPVAADPVDFSPLIDMLRERRRRKREDEDRDVELVTTPGISRDPDFQPPPGLVDRLVGGVKAVGRATGIVPPSTTPPKVPTVRVPDIATPAPTTTIDASGRVALDIPKPQVTASGASLADVLQPVRFATRGKGYVFDPRAAIGYEAEKAGIQTRARETSQTLGTIDAYRTAFPDVSSGELLDRLKPNRPAMAAATEGGRNARALDALAWKQHIDTMRLQLAQKEAAARERYRSATIRLRQDAADKGANEELRAAQAALSAARQEMMTVTAFASLIGSDIPRDPIDRAVAESMDPEGQAAAGTAREGARTAVGGAVERVGTAAEGVRTTAQNIIDRVGSGAKPKAAATEPRFADWSDADQDAAVDALGEQATTRQLIDWLLKNRPKRSR